MATHQSPSVADPVAVAHTERSLQDIHQQLTQIQRQLQGVNRRTKAVHSQGGEKKDLILMAGFAAWFGVVLMAKLLIQSGIPQALTGLSEFLAGETGPLNTSPLKEGDKLGKYTITSGFGLRPSPGGMGSTNHQGVDVAMEVGTALVSPVDAQIECNSDAKTGLHAIIKPPPQAYVPWEFLAGHLSECYPAFYQAGQVFGKSGNTGISTGPHLHWGQYKPAGEPINPQRGYLERVLGVARKQVRGDDVTRLRTAIIGQESGGSTDLLNASGSGAMGLGQIMPENLGAWSQECLGRSLTSSEFLQSAQLQTQIIDCKLQQYWEISLKSAHNNRQEAVRRVASWWYSGDPHKFIDTAPQRWGADTYPSIAEYSQSVWRRFGQ